MKPMWNAHLLLAVLLAFIGLSGTGTAYAGVDPAVPGDYTAIIAAPAADADQASASAASDAAAMAGVMVLIDEVVGAWFGMPHAARAVMLLLLVLLSLPHLVAILQAMFPRYFDSRTWDDWVIRHGGVIGRAARLVWRLLLARYGRRT